MSIASGAHTFASSITSSATITTANVTSSATGSTFSLFTVWFNAAGPAAAPSSVTDSKGNTYTQVGSTLTSSTDGLSKSALYECVNGVGGANHNFIVNFAGTPQDVVSIWAVEVTGAPTSSPKDQAPGGNEDLSSPFTSNTTGTTSQANELILTYCATYSVSGTETITWGNSFIGFGDDVTNANNAFTGSSAKRNVTATGTYQSSFTSTGAGTTGGMLFIITYKESGGGVTPTTNPTAVFLGFNF